MSELTVHASTCETVPMVQIDDLRAEFSARLKRALSHHGVSEWGAGVRLAEIAGVTPKASSKWLTKESIPSRANMVKIADALGVQVQWLEYGEGPMQPSGSEAWGTDSPTAIADIFNTEGQARRIKQGLIPIKGKAMLGDNGFFEEMDYPQGAGDGYLKIYSDDPDAYALRVVGNSMEPRIRSGEFVMIEPNQGYVAGDEVLVRTEEGRAMIKVFMYRRAGEVRLLSVNDSHPPITLAESSVTVIHPVGAIVKPSRLIEL